MPIYRYNHGLGLGEEGKEKKIQSKCRRVLLQSSKIKVKVKENQIKVMSRLMLKPMNANDGLGSSDISVSVGGCSVWPLAGL